ncbi:MAG: hypothetical protein OEW19_19880 [Acidobacteriota bacterium]|nr:hypothetical protein [Acidobacteriota bacterium]
MRYPVEAEPCLVALDPWTQLLMDGGEVRRVPWLAVRRRSE